ncbi:RNA-dependent RNA polymerase 1 [Pyrus ussuriensis x Pyrus communis]|uniref:RNA-dependent RNA polymerase n=1 Tax=Pyrus ussuriensis x Pyrus communis TaxID=2448454 RepID=A0A5N5H1N2_9ROSA|nr:RNA-dependent RNA polymerase 1 [Pyrus ussuriensis x Pyrus communis]
MVYVHRVQVTPSKVYFCGPEVNLSNRVLRKYPQDIDNFLRVSFVDEDLGKIRSKDLCLRPRTSNTSAEEERRTRKFEFLAFSSSQLREHSVWMFASRSELSAQDIRNWMGDFKDIRNVAKYGTRLGQAFSSSRETFNVDIDEIELIPDVKIERSGVKYCFSDGIGKISAEFAERVARKCGRSSTPSAFQIRIGGYKGVVAVDPTLTKNLALRESMCKYQSNNTALDVLKWSKYQPCFLNRQLITLLSTNGVPDHVFQRKQRQALNQLEGVLTDPSRAKEALETIFQGEVTDVLKEMLSCGYKPDAEPFLSLTLQAFCASKLMELRKKTRIFVSSGRSMMGCLDETGTLEYGHVFVQYSRRVISTGSAHSNTTSSEEKFVVDRNVVVARNPCLHPGDIRVLTAVDVPALHHMVDCVVFPQKGERPHPDECSGGDLDGDFYFVSWDSDLIPPRKARPMNYTPAPTIELDHDVTMEEVAESFTNYIVNDMLGIISNAHAVFADTQPQKAMSAQCIELAKLCSYAVDSPKTGVVVEVPRSLRAKEYPDFMEMVEKPTYESRRVIGKLFRQVKNVELGSNSSSIKSFTVEVARKEYDYKLGNLMDYYGIKTEADILTGNITSVSKFFDKRKDLETINYTVRSLKKEARTWFYANQSDSSTNVDDVSSTKASAWYYVTYHPRYWGCCNKGMERDHFLSFPWCVFDKLIQIKREKTSTRNSFHMSDQRGVKLDKCRSTCSPL